MQGTKDEDAYVVGLAYFPSDYDIVRKFVVLVTTKHYLLYYVVLFELPQY